MKLAFSTLRALICLCGSTSLLTYSQRPQALPSSVPQQKNRQELIKLLEDLQRARALPTSFLGRMQRDMNARIPSHHLTDQDVSDPLAGLVSQEDRGHEKDHERDVQEDRSKKAYKKSTQATIRVLGQIINTNCTYAARRLHAQPVLHATHPYLYKVLHELLGQSRSAKTLPVAEVLIKNEQFYTELRQKAQSTRTSTKKDPTIAALKELSKHLHYYRWFKAIRQSHDSLSQNGSHYQESTKGLPENLQLIISSMLNESMR